MGSESVTTIKMQRVPKTLRPGQMFFRPALVWQTMLDDHVADAGLEFSLDVSTGRNQARFISDARIETGSARWHEVMHKQLALVASADGREDQDAVKKQLIAAGTWGEAGRVAQLIRTCYITPAVANQVLVEVAGAGAVEVIQVLLQAGACPDYAEPALDGKTALHVACEAGHEDIAALLIASMSPEGVARETRSGGHTAIQMLRRSGRVASREGLRPSTQTQKGTRTSRLLDAQGIRPRPPRCQVQVHSECHASMDSLTTWRCLMLAGVRERERELLFKREAEHLV